MEVQKEIIREINSIYFNILFCMLYFHMLYNANINTAVLGKAKLLELLN